MNEMKETDVRQIDEIKCDTEKPSEEAPVETAKAAKAVVWYTFGSVLLKGIAFLTTPIFTRILSKADYGAYSNIATWSSLISIFATMELSASMLRARSEFKNDIYRFMFSLMPFGNLFTVALYVLACVFMNDVSRITSIEPIYIHMIFITLLFTPATTMLMTHFRFQYRYQLSTVISIGSSVAHIAVSIGLVFALSNKLLGRSIGHFAVSAVIGLACYLILFAKGRRVKVSYWKYAIKISFPLTLHLLSMYILSQSDRLMITAIRGNEENAMYALAYSCGVILSFLWSALNSAFSPIIGDTLTSGNYQYTRKMTAPYLAVYIVPTFFLMLVGPELVFIMGGESYMEAVYAIPPVVAGSILQYMYTLYVNIEQYEKKTWGVAFGTVIAAATNIGLNALLIPIMGYIAAAYTTLFCYMLLFLVHFTLVRFMKKAHYYNTKIVFGIAALVLLFAAGSTLLYMHTVVRLVLSGCYVVLILWLLFKYKSMIIGLFRSKKV